MWCNISWFIKATWLLPGLIIVIIIVMTCTPWRSRAPQRTARWRWMEEYACCLMSAFFLAIGSREINCHHKYLDREILWGPADDNDKFRMILSNAQRVFPFIRWNVCTNRYTEHFNYIRHQLAVLNWSFSRFAISFITFGLGAELAAGWHFSLVIRFWLCNTATVQ